MGRATRTQSEDNGQTWFYRGDIGARPRRYWRNYARKVGAVLRYE